MLLTLTALAGLLTAPQDEQAKTLFVVASLPYIADIARQVGGDKVTAISLVPPGVDPHHVEFTPAQLADLRRADLFLENGMQLEAWAPKVLEASGRGDLAQGSAAHAFVTNGIVPVELPTAAELDSGGHVHAAGNPHAWLHPLNLKIVASNVAGALTRVAPEHRKGFQEGRVRFEKRMDVAFFGKDLHALLGGRTLDQLHRSGRLIDFLERREVKGETLIHRLGGWLGRVRQLGDTKVISYHRTWSYLELAFGLDVVSTLEENPGIPPGPAYLEQLSQLARAEAVRVVIAPPYYPSVRLEGFAERIDGVALTLPTQPGEVDGTTDVIQMFERIITSLEAAFAGR